MAKKKSGNGSTSKGKERPPPVEKLIKPAIGIGLALLAYQFIKGIRSEIPRINVDDELELRHVFFGEGDTPQNVKHSNYAVLCHSDPTTTADEEGGDPRKKKSLLPVSSVFQDAFQDGTAPAEFRLLDCDSVLADSNKSINERFNLNVKQRPTIFVSGQVGPPKQVPSKHLKTGSMLVKALKNLLEKKAEKIETTQELRTKCLDKPICGLLFKGSKTSPNYVKTAIQKLLHEYPKVTFAAVDTSVLYVKGLEAEYMPEFVSGQPRFAVFEKVVDPKKPDRLKTSVAALPTSGVSYGPMSNLLAGVIQKTQEMTKIPALPTIKTRTKKLEQEEKAKRQRRLEQQKRQDQGGSGGSSTGSTGGFFENDGSKEGRRAERERRRAEHRANNPNYREKTPEEIAEMERQRRKRMEEEAAKWNIAPEDAPEEGDPVGDGDDLDDYGSDGSSYMVDEDEDDDEEDVEDLDDDDDEDVLDLD